MILIETFSKMIYLDLCWLLLHHWMVGDESMVVEYVVRNKRGECANIPHNDCLNKEINVDYSFAWIAKNNLRFKIKTERTVNMTAKKMAWRVYSLFVPKKKHGKFSLSFCALFTLLTENLKHRNTNSRNINESEKSQQMTLITFSSNATDFFCTTRL